MWGPGDNKIFASEDNDIVMLGSVWLHGLSVEIALNSIKDFGFLSHNKPVSLVYDCIKVYVY